MPILVAAHTEDNDEDANELMQASPTKNTNATRHDNASDMLIGLRLVSCIILMPEVCICAIYEFRMKKQRGDVWVCV